MGYKTMDRKPVVLERNDTREFVAIEGWGRRSDYTTAVDGRPVESLALELHREYGFTMDFLKNALRTGEPQQVIASPPRECHTVWGYNNGRFRL